MTLDSSALLAVLFSEPGYLALIDQMLEAGTWYFIVDGWRDGSYGEYFLEVAVNPP